MPLGSRYNAIVIAIDLAASVPSVAVVITLTYRSINPAVVKAIRPVPGVTHGVVIPAVRIIVHQAEVERRAGEIGMPWTVHIVPVIYIDISSVVIKDTIRPVVDIEPTYAANATIPIADAYITDLIHTTVEIVIDGYMLHLDHGAIVVILYKRIIVESGIKSNACASQINMPTYLVESIDKEIKFPIRIDRKGDPTFCEDERLSISISVIRSGFNRTGLCQSC